MSEADNAVIRMFRWWNEAYLADDFTADSFSRHFAPDIVFTVNGNLRGRDCAELAAAFRRIRASTRAVRLCLPVIESFGDGERIFVHYRCEATTDDGDAAEDAMAYATIRDGKIARMTVSSRAIPAGA